MRRSFETSNSIRAIYVNDELRIKSNIDLLNKSKNRKTVSRFVSNIFFLLLLFFLKSFLEDISPVFSGLSHDCFTFYPKT